MYILFDIGGTKMRIARSINGESFEEAEILDTPENYEEGFKIFYDKVMHLVDGTEVKKIVGGISRSIPNWSLLEFQKNLTEKFNTEVIVENDAALAGLGEALRGAGKDFKIVAYLTVSTGVGGVRIVNGKIDDKNIGFEPGKQIVDIKEEKTLEDLISGRGLQNRFGMKPKDITNPVLWQELAKQLAVGLNNIIVEWSPDVVVVGGSMITGEPAISLKEAEDHLTEIMTVFTEIPPVKKAELGQFGALYGALSLLK